MSVLTPQGQGRVPNLVVAQRVLDNMLAAAARYLADETGEALVGLLAPGLNTNGVPTVYLLDTIAPDESAVREWATFQQGDEIQQERFWWLAENWRVLRDHAQAWQGAPLPDKWNVPLRHVGDWHKQPGHMIAPSQGDLYTARSMVAESASGLEFLVAPILTLGYHPHGEPPPQANYLYLSQTDGSAARVDFWYLDRALSDFQPICPSVYPNAQLPLLPAYPWHMRDGGRLNAEYDALEAAGLRVSAPILWPTHGTPPLEVCFMLTLPQAQHLLLLSTPADFPTRAPQAYRAPLLDQSDLLAAFETAWPQATALPPPDGWRWEATQSLLDYVSALQKQGWEGA